MPTMTAKNVTVPGATLYYEVTGSGPVLLCISGGPTDAGVFADFHERLSDRYTVVAYDQRGHSRSTLDGDPRDVAVSVHADDAAAVLRAVTDEPAYVYGSSGGGTIGLELVARHPGLVKTFLAHEAPVMTLLDDAERWRGIFDDIATTYRTEGVFPAMGKFGAAVEEGGPKYSEEMAQQEPSQPQQEMGARMGGNFEHFMAHEILPIGNYEPDIDKLTSVSTRIISAIGETSEQQGACRAGAALARALGAEPAVLPGAHGGWGSDPQDFADRVDALLRG